jgi:hypothetical protein
MVAAEIHEGLFAGVRRIHVDPSCSHVSFNGAVPSLPPNTTMRPRPSSKAAAW